MKMAPLIGSQNNILVIQDGRLLSFNLQQQSINWENTDTFTGQTSLAKGIIYAINGGVLTVLDETTGNQLWSWTPPAGNLTGTMIVTDTHVIAGTDSAIYAVELLSRTHSWSYPAHGDLALREDTLYKASDDGILIDAVPPIAQDGMLKGGAARCAHVDAIPIPRRRAAGCLHRGSWSGRQRLPARADGGPLRRAGPGCHARAVCATHGRAAWLERCCAV